MSFCCARDGCRRRTTPPSVRFLGRKVYLSVMVVLATALQHGVTEKRRQGLIEMLDIAPRTVVRWRRFWCEIFPQSRCWQTERGRFMPPSDAGRTRRLAAGWVAIIRKPVDAHPGWTVQLHYDNLKARALEEDRLAALPSYGTIRRYLKAQGCHRRRPPKRKTPGAEPAAQRLETREVRSFEAEYSHALWHLDFHHGSHKVLTRFGQWITPLLLGFIDDRCGLLCYPCNATGMRPPRHGFMVSARPSRNGGRREHR